MKTMTEGFRLKYFDGDCIWVSKQEWLEMTASEKSEHSENFEMSLEDFEDEVDFGRGNY